MYVIYLLIYIFLRKYFQTFLILQIFLLLMNQYAGVSPAFVPNTLGNPRQSSEQGRAASYKEIGNSTNAGKRSVAQHRQFTHLVSGKLNHCANHLQTAIEHKG